MNLKLLNPYVRQVAVYETVRRTEPHVAADCRLLYMISGDLTYTIGSGKRAHLTPGSLLYIPAGTPYSLKSKYLRLAVFAFDPVYQIDAPAEPLPPTSVTEPAKADAGPLLIPPFDHTIILDGMEGDRDSIVQMNDIFTSAEGNYQARLSAMLKLLLLRVAERVEENALPAQMVDALDTYIRENCHDELSNTELGATFGYHPFYISRMLKEKRGLTMHQYVIRYRMKLAYRLLLTTDRTVTDIAEATGFADSSYFTKSFKAEYGLTPRALRARCQEDFI